MVKEREETVTKIKRFLLANADAIQKLATNHHKEFLGGDTVTTERLGRYIANHLQVVKQIASNMGVQNLKQGTVIFKKLGKTLALDSIKDGLTLEEAMDGIIFLKQAVWQLLEQEEIIDEMTVREFYQVSQKISIYSDVIASKIALEYHHQYEETMKNELAARRKLEQQKDEFIAMASHELKTPVTSVKVFTRILQGRFARMGDEKSALLLMKMDAQLNKLTMLVTDLLDVNKIEAGKLQLHEGWFDFNELVSEIIDQIQLTTEKQTIKKKLGTTKTVYADRDRIGQVLINLLTNAIKYAPQADTIIVKTTSDHTSVTASIQDFGMGIAREHQEKIFERFYQINGEKRTYPGMGLGLYISKQIIEREGGKLWVHSTPGKGALFSFSLPAKQYKKT
jgi:signal transduction histidine kinase